MSKLKAWRESAGLSQDALGKKIGVSSVAIGRYERGRVPEPDVMQKIIEISAAAVQPNDWFQIPQQGEAA